MLSVVPSVWLVAAVFVRCCGVCLRRGGCCLSFLCCVVGVYCGLRLLSRRVLVMVLLVGVGVWAVFGGVGCLLALCLWLLLRLACRVAWLALVSVPFLRVL
jgi:hypothetical protein